MGGWIGEEEATIPSYGWGLYLSAKGDVYTEGARGGGLVRKLLRKPAIRGGKNDDMGNRRA